METSDDLLGTSVETLLGITTMRQTTLNLEAVKRAPVSSVLTYGDSDWAGDADRFSMSGTASWLRGKLGTPITASSKKTFDDRQQW